MSPIEFIRRSFPTTIVGVACILLWTYSPADADCGTDNDWWDGFAAPPAGQGLDGGLSVNGLAVHDGKLVAGGDFSEAGSVIFAGNIAAWDGAQWSALGGFNDNVDVLFVWNDDLIAGGWFTSSGGTTVSKIARWPAGGTEWEPLDTGITGTGVYALGEYNGDLIVGGQFVAAGGIPAGNLARWDGASWHVFGTGAGEGVEDFAVYDGKLIAGGYSPLIGGVPNYIAAWDGVSWSPLGAGVNDHVRALLVYQGDLIVAGDFSTAGEDSASGVARWDGSAWHPLGGGVPIEPSYLGAMSLGVHEGDLYVGGRFPVAGGVTVNNIARWDGSGWSALGSGITLGHSVFAVAEYGAHLYIGGNFFEVGGKPSRLIARWTQPACSDLALTKTVDDPVPCEQEDIEYTVALTNLGPGAATNVEITDLWPAGVDYVSHTVTQGAYVPGTGIWSLASIASGTSDTLTIAASVNSGTGGSTITNTASVTAVDQSDPNPGNESASVDINPAADLSAEAQDFEALDQSDLQALANDGWLVFANIFDPSGTTYLYGYGGPAPNDPSNPAFCLIATGEGGPGQGAQQLVVFSDYNSPEHGNGSGNLVESNVYQEQTIGPGDIGRNWVFEFDAKRGDLAGATTALAFIKTLDPAAGWYQTNFVTVDMTTIPTTWNTYSVSLLMDNESLCGQRLQFGFANTASNYELSGVFYDNVHFALDPATDVQNTPSAGLPTQLVLGRAQPNPFEQRTTIHYAIPQKASVTLRVYDVAGKLVRVLEDSALPPGRHTSVWDGRDRWSSRVASGIYFYRLEAGNFSQTRKLVHLR